MVTPEPPEAKAYILKADDLIDVTDKIRVMYDAIVESLDWGSGFLDSDDVDAMLDVGDAMGFTLPTTTRYDAKGKVITVDDPQVTEWRKRRQAKIDAVISDAEGRT